MGVDAFVMPLWKYRTGDFETPLDAAKLGETVTHVSPAGLFERRRWTGAFARWRAKRSVRRLAREVGDANSGMPIAWNDEGSVVYSEQFRFGDAIRAYLWWFDRRDVFKAFQLPKEDDESARSFWNTEPNRPPSFPHLSGNGYYNDYFLPVDFPRVAEVEPYKIFGTWDANKRASSTPRAWRELEILDRELRIPDTFTWDNTDPLSPAREAFWRLREVLALSQQHGLPVIFWG